jgi:hypothetical protein
MGIEKFLSMTEKNIFMNINMKLSFYCINFNDENRRSKMIKRFKNQNINLKKYFYEYKYEIIFLLYKF